MKCLEMCFYFQTFINFLNFRLSLFYDLTPVVEGHTVESQPLSVCSFLFCGLTHGQFCGVFHAPLRTRTVLLWGAVPGGRWSTCAGVAVLLAFCPLVLAGLSSRVVSLLPAVELY